MALPSACHTGLAEFGDAGSIGEPSTGTSPAVSSRMSSPPGPQPSLRAPPGLEKRAAALGAAAPSSLAADGALPPGLICSEPTLHWSPFFGPQGSQERDSPQRRLFVGGFSFEDQEEDGGDADQEGRPLPLLLGNKTDPEYTPGEVLSKIAVYGNPSALFGNASYSEEECAPPVDFQGCTLSSTKASGYRVTGSRIVKVDAMPNEIDPSGPSDAVLGSKDVPTMGSYWHQSRTCKPCAFAHTKGCQDGFQCQFCHLCEPGEKKRRKKEKNAYWRSVNRVNQFQKAGYWV